ncbi:methyltransferase-like protein 22 isoform X1 [Euwallacea similis]|uniref:methyltransferase-like protein 22 isoform X1 n=2 Tax=Euwallacea similis TaxID=1736056 RepID=UPI00344B91A3
MNLEVMEDEIYEISSELYEEYDYTSKSKPSVNPKGIVSQLPFNLPAYSITDKEGDILIPRRNRKKSEYDEFLDIEHSYSTNLRLVGLQIWRGALLLADWFLHYGHSLSQDDFILELGSGVGLSSIVASMFTPVICTDVDRADIFKTIRANVMRNAHLSKYPVEILELDFTAEQLPEKISTLLPKIKLIFAADVVYDDHLTEAFVKTVKRLLDIPPQRSILIALEKRYVFTISDCDTCAPCYDYFLESIKSLSNVIMKEVALDFPQYFKYDRCKELVLWKITSKNQ